MDITQMVQNQTSEIYKNEVMEALRLSFPGLYESELREAVNYSIMKRGGDSPAVLDNNYTKVIS